MKADGKKMKVSGFGDCQNLFPQHLFSNTGNTNFSAQGNVMPAVPNRL
jgi:hypothetical protein